MQKSELHLVELLGNWPGALLVLRRLRHKCAKPSYQFVFWCIVGLFQLASADILFDQLPSTWARVQIEPLMERARTD